MSLTVQQLLNDAKKLSGRLRDHDTSADNVISSAQSVLKEIEAMRQYQEDIDGLNSIAHNRPRAQLVLGIQQENRHIRQLQHENKELRAALEEHQNALELIMSKYREHMACLINSTKVDPNLVNSQKAALLQERADKICEMAGVMQKSIQVDEENQAKEQELISRLITENKGLREMLEISFRNGSHSNPLVGPKLVTRSSQTETDSHSSNSNSLSHSTTTSETVNDDPDAGRNNGRSVTDSRPQPDLDEDSSGRRSTTSSLNGSISPQPRDAADSIRPLSSASEESEDTYSDDDEIIFNTIKRQAKKQIYSGPEQIYSGPETTELCAVTVNVKPAKEELLKVNGDNNHLADCLMDQQKEVFSQS